MSVRWLGAYTPGDGLVHVVALPPGIDDTITWRCPAHTHGVHSRKFMLVGRVNCIPCMVAYVEGWDGQSTRCHYVE